MPSAKILEAKQAVVAELAEKVKTAASGVIVSYQGITVEDDTKLRAALRAAGVEYSVMKNTLTGRACKEAGLGDAMDQYLNGMTAIAISEKDAVAPAKILKQYADKIETFEIRAGFIDGAVIDQNILIRNVGILLCQLVHDFAPQAGSFQNVCLIHGRNFLAAQTGQFKGAATDPLNLHLRVGHLVGGFLSPIFGHVFVALTEVDTTGQFADHHQVNALFGSLFF